MKDWKERFRQEFVKYGTDEMENDYYFIDTEPQYIEKFIQSELDRQKEEIIKRIEKYQYGFTKDDGAGEGSYIFAPEFAVINDLLMYLDEELKGER